MFCFHISEMFPLMFQTNMALLDSCRPHRKDIQSMSPMCLVVIYLLYVNTPPLSNFMNPQQSNYVASFINWLATLIVFHWYTAWRSFSFSDFTKRTKNIPYSLYFFTRVDLLENCDKGLVIWIPSLIFFN